MSGFSLSRTALEFNLTTDLPVCLDCSIQHGLELAHAVSLIEASRLLAISERNFGLKFESFTFPEYIGGFSPEEVAEVENVVK